jgi:hypothetical protein
MGHNEYLYASFVGGGVAACVGVVVEEPIRGLFSGENTPDEANFFFGERFFCTMGSGS